MKPTLHTLVIALLATVAFAPAQEAPAKKKKMAPLNQVSEPRMGKFIPPSRKISDLRFVWMTTSGLSLRKKPIKS